jgi:predicted TIM-barrel fold metal-dependent hydrolase
MSRCLYLILLSLVSVFSTALAANYNDTFSNLTYITLEEHWVSPAMANLTQQNPVLGLLINGTFGPLLGNYLRDIDTLRLQNMTDNGIRMQVVSHASCPICMEYPDLVSQGNDQLASAVSKYPQRFRGFAFLPMADPAAAAAELERVVTKLGLVGALIDNRLANGSYYDGYQFWPVWAMAEKLNVPIYIHPSLPDPSEVTDIGTGIYAPAAPLNFPLFTSADLGTAAWGFHDTTGLHFLRLYTAGVFATFPNLKIILGHMGEMVPYMLERSDSFLSPRNTSQASLIDVYAKNVWITTAGFFSLNPMGTVLRNTAIDRIMYSVDYPFSSGADGNTFMMSLRTSGLVTGDEWRAIAYGNAEKLLKLSASKGTRAVRRGVPVPKLVGLGA